MKTPAEWSRRVKGLTAAPGQTTVTFMDLNATPPLVEVTYDQILNGSQLNFKGTPTLVHAGTVTGWTNHVPSTNTPYQITDTGVTTFTPYLNLRLRNTTAGARFGVCCTIEKAISANVCKVQAPYKGSSAIPFNLNPVLTQFVINDTYAIENLTILQGMRVNNTYLGEAFSAGGGIVLEDIGFIGTDSSSFSCLGSNDPAIMFLNCDLGFSSFNGPQYIFAVSCRWGFFNITGTSFEGIGVSFQQFGDNVQRGAFADLTDCSFQSISGPIDINSGGFIELFGDTAIFDGPDTIRVDNGGVFRCRGTVYGTGNTFVLQAQGGGQIQLDTISNFFAVGSSAAIGVDSFLWSASVGQYRDNITGSMVAFTSTAVGNGPTTRAAKIFWSCSALAGLTAAQCLPPGYVGPSLVAATDTIGLICSAPDQFSTMTFTHTGSGSNGAGQTISYVLKKNGTLVTGATCTVAANASTVITVSFTAFQVAVGDKLTLIATPSATLSVGVTDIMGALS